MTAPEPIGVAVAFAPWNYPAVIIARKLAAALVAGCPVILKGAEETPNTAVAVAQALFDAGLPRAALQLLFGRPAEISEALLASPIVRVMSFTGSTPVGKQLARLASANLVRTVLELGGHSPVVICRDADIGQAAAAVAAYKYDCTGQSCNAPSRVFIERESYDDFVEAFSAISSRVHVGDGLDADVDMGPMANARRIEAMLRLTEDARRKGGRVLMGGARLERIGFFFPPTIVVDAPADSRIFIEEPFGPILPVVPVNSVDEAIARANDNLFGLASYVFSADPATAADVARRLEAGSIGINQMKGVPPDAAAAGIKDSGYGYEGGSDGVRAFQNRKLISETRLTAASS
jgi:succinate-semialdehyde dehydrogenase/glutarate-semialdehyde dehydrogenase